MLKAGFARVDITPPLGVSVQGYFEPRYADGVLDPLLATAVAFDDGERRAVVMSVDLIGMNQIFQAKIRETIMKENDLPENAIFIACTHTHLGPGVASAAAVDGEFDNPEYGLWLIKRLSDLANLALQDLAPATMKYTRGEVKGVSFIRRYRMKDGSVRTNPGWQNPDIDHALCTPDEESQLLIIKREGKPEIGIVNFQVHPDVIGGCALSADYPKFVRDTYELNVPNSLCMYLNGAQGDSNHIDVTLNPETECAGGYDRARYMGRKIAMSVISNYELAKDLPGDKVNFAKKIITVKHNKGTPEEIPAALELAKRYHELGSEGALPDVKGMLRTEMIAKATRIERMQALPDYKELPITALSVGDMVFAGFPGEPFTDVGRGIKANSKFTLTIPCCCANGYEGYYPMQSAFDEGGYEALTARYVAGTAEKLIETSTEIVNGLK
ncbi:MAG: neutral/alkaline non-lysosomal ceramidase N-terminal domain-containing protein [Oscillospiraceae bacterium]|nr:neutral/alkaline non-lysosomal ceramidase N-terminal domain-containing protein [Oscillospiraceae bacterium]